MLKAYKARVVTDEARDIAEKFPANRQDEPRSPLTQPEPRVPLKRGFDPSKGRRQERVRAQHTRAIEFGDESIDISLLPQFIDPGQARTIGDWLLRCARGLADDKATLMEICEELESRCASEGLSATTERGYGDRVQARRFELGAAINRLRSLQIASGERQDETR